MFATAYPVRVDGALDRHLSRWLPAVPHYLVVGLFVGGAYAVWHGGLIGVLVLIAAVIVAVTASYRSRCSTSCSG